MFKNIIKKTIVCLSIATLFNIFFIQELVFIKEIDKFYQYEITKFHYFAIIILILLISSIFYLVLYFYEKRNSIFYEIIFFIILILFSLNFINFIRIILNIPISFIVEYFYIIFITSTLFIILIIYAKIFRYINKIIIFIYAILSPFSFYCLIFLFFNSINTNNFIGLDNYNKLNPVKIKNDYLILLIFDEWDYEITNNLLNEGKLINLQNLINGSIYSKARQAGPGTYFSIFSMISGQDIVETKINSKNEINFSKLVNNVDKEDKRLYDIDTDKNYSNFFIRKNGKKIKRFNNKNLEVIFNNNNFLKLNSIVHGSYIPYCKIYYNYIDQCIYYNYGSKIPIYKGNFINLILNFIENYNIGLSNAILRYKNQSKNFIENINNDNFDFLYGHFSIPHWPYIYDSINKKYRSTFNTGNREDEINKYKENIILLDIFVGQIIKSLRESDILEKTTLILTSDTHSDVAWGGDISNINTTVPLIIKTNNIRYKSNYTINNKKFIFEITSNFINKKNLTNQQIYNILENSIEIEGYQNWWTP